MESGLVTGASGTSYTASGRPKVYARRAATIAQLKSFRVQSKGPGLKPEAAG